MNWIRYRSSFAAAVLILIFTVITMSYGHARDFTIVSWGGASQQVRSKMFFEPFAKSKNISFLEDVYLGGWGVFQAMKDTGNIPWDVVQVESSELARGCEEDVFVSLDWSRIVEPSKLIPEAVSRCGVGMALWSISMAFDVNRFSKPPSKLKDFWDLKTWPGKRGLRQGPKTNLEFALMVDGVPPSEVYKVLRTKEGVDRAFRKLDEIKPVLQFWKAGAQTVNWLLAGEVAMTTTYNATLNRAKKEGHSLDLSYDHALYAVDSWAILKGSPHVNTAYEFVKFYAQSKRHVELSKTIINVPTVIDALESMPRKMQIDRPMGDNLKNALFMGDEHVEFWLDNQESLTQRWNSWTARD